MKCLRAGGCLHLDKPPCSRRFLNVTLKQSAAEEQILNDGAELHLLKQKMNLLCFSVTDKDHTNKKGGGGGGIFVGSLSNGFPLPPSGSSRPVSVIRMHGESECCAGFI
ncbi:unnamed protein product [Pleuronectes platessa]|uniref:Uncharacterized protein n=1 Tax=Pleuronectes platessa TaxID=8262 RepID=A0A9N7U290_PLEPL|nr:unnamed protein product [Pleuronectes platessa]